MRFVQYFLQPQKKNSSFIVLFLQSIEDIIQKPVSAYHPLTINTNFSTPINLTNIRRDDSPLIKNEPSPSFASIFSPPPTIRTETTITPHITQKSSEIIINSEQTTSIISPTGTATGGIEFRLNKSSIDLTTVTSPQTNRKNIIIPDLHEDNEQKETNFRFPDFNITRRRSSSAHYLKKSIRAEQKP